MSMAALRRLAEVAFTLLLHGLKGLFPALWGRSPRPLAHSLAGGFERLGPAFIKFGQFLSVRPDLVGFSFAEGFERLRDSAAPLLPGEVEKAVKGELHRLPAELFAHFDPAPLASASISQVHRAVTKEGREIVLKIQRPGIRDELIRDLSLLKLAAKALDRLNLQKKAFSFLEIAGEVERSVLGELDFLAEAETAERFAINFRREPGVVIPGVHWAYTTGRVLAMDFIPGWRISAPEAKTLPGYSGLAEKGANCFFRQVVEFGLFHADLHPSNLFLTPDGQIAYLDFGIRGELSEEEREAVLGALTGLLARAPEFALKNLEKLGVKVEEKHRAVFIYQAGRVMEAEVGRTLEDTSTARIGLGLLKAVKANGVYIPHKYALLVKALLTVEGAARTLHPGFGMEEAAREYLSGALAGRARPSLALEAWWRAEAVGWLVFHERPEQKTCNGGPQPI